MEFTQKLRSTDRWPQDERGKRDIASVVIYDFPGAWRMALEPGDADSDTGKTKVVYWGKRSSTVYNSASLRFGQIGFQDDAADLLVSAR